MSVICTAAIFHHQTCLFVFLFAFYISVSLSHFFFFFFCQLNRQARGGEMTSIHYPRLGLMRFFPDICHICVSTIHGEKTDWKNGKKKKVTTECGLAGGKKTREGKRQDGRKEEKRFVNIDMDLLPGGKMAARFLLLLWEPQTKGRNLSAGKENKEVCRLWKEGRGMIKKGKKKWRIRGICKQEVREERTACKFLLFVYTV